MDRDNKMIAAETHDNDWLLAKSPNTTIPQRNTVVTSR
jgi:hypothetical protein